MAGPDRRARWLVAAAALAALWLAPLPAGAQADGAEVSAEELRLLVARAATDPAAAERLRRVERVDGRPVDLARALAGAEGDELAARLAALDPGAEPSPAADGAAARGAARDILDGRRFNPSPVPRPFRGVLRRLGGWLRPVTEPLGRLWEQLAEDTAATVVLGVAVVVVSAVLAARSVGRRTTAGLGRARERREAAHHDDPDALEQRASAAEAAGDLEWAVRLRFRAGLLRLHLAGAIVDRPALTTGELTRHLPLPHLPELTVAFEEVAYGGRAATPGDVEAARTGWPRVLEEAGRE